MSNPNFDDKQQPRIINSLSASQKERREEDVRRKARLQEGFATPGLTSALPGARDFAINIAQTEREYLQSLGSSDDDSVIDERNVDKYVAIWTEEGLAHLRMLRFQEASQYSTRCTKSNRMPIYGKMDLSSITWEIIMLRQSHWQTMLCDMKVTLGHLKLVLCFLPNET